MASTPTLEDLVEAAAVRGVERYLERFTRRLAEPECLTYTVPQAAKVIGTSETTVRRLINEGRLPLVPHVGDRVLIPRKALHQYIEAAS